MRRAPRCNGTHPERRDGGLHLRFAGCAIDAERRSLERRGEPVEVEPRVFDFLVYLIEHRDRVVSTEELVEAVWDGVAVTTSSLSRAVYKARQAVGDDGEAQRIIRTVHGRGFRFVAPVSLSPRPPVGVELLPPIAPEWHLARLEEALRSAERGRGGIVLVTGAEARGAGRLARAFAGRVRTEGHVATHPVRCFEGLEVVPYWPWRQLADALASDRLTAELEALASGTIAPRRPDAATANGVATPPPTPGLAAGPVLLRRFERVMEALANEARERPLLILVEDLHWADLPSLAFLRFLAPFLPDLPILVVATLGDTDLSGDGEGEWRRLLAELGSDVGIEALRLGPGPTHPPAELLDAYPPPRAPASLGR